MNNVSLKKLTLFVTIAAVTAPFVDANELQLEEKKSTAAQLLQHFDTDKNGSLSKKEIGASDKKKLQLAFDKIDSDGDATITEAELDAFLVQANKANSLVVTNQ